MDWLKITIYSTADGIDAVCGRLYNLGITGTEIEDFDDFSDFLKENTQIWDYVDDDLIESKKGETKIICYISNTSDAMETLVNIKNSLSELKQFDVDRSFGRLEIDETMLNEEDWANNWKKYFHPMEVGERLLICPEWEVVEDTERTVFKINPGMTFGTGSHHTTRLCIESLEQYITPACAMADLGCGSGILSVISLMLGASHATAVDIDSNALNVAYDNAERNNIDKDKYRVLVGNILDDNKVSETIADRKYDVVCANIVADVIISLLPYVKQILADDGTFITSGIIIDRKDDVRAAIDDNGLAIVEEKTSGEWVCFVCKRIEK